MTAALAHFTPFRPPDLARAQVFVWLVAIALGGCDRLHGDRTAPDATPPGRYDTVTGKVSFFGQTLRSANLQVGHESWTFKDGAPPDVQCLAQTNDGFLWLCAPNGLLRFDGTRFEPFRSPFGDRLLSTDAYSLFVPPSGGLWIGYTIGGFSFLDNGRVTNYASETGSVYGFAQHCSPATWTRRWRCP